MHPEAYTFIAGQAAEIGRCRLVVELGSRDVNGSVRHLFDAERYVGVDCLPGRNVDVVADAATYQPDAPPDVVICAETLEHASGAEDICRHALEILAPHGVLILTAAGPGRAPHSAVDGRDLRDGEFYRNVGAEDLRIWLDGFAGVTIATNPKAGDIYARAVKTGVGKAVTSTPRRAVMLWYPGASMSTCDVAAGLQYGLDQAGMRVIAYNAEVEIEIAGAALEYLWRKKGRPPEFVPSTADKIYRAGKAVVADAARARREYGVEWVIVVSGMYQHPDFLVLLRDCGFKVAMVFTESPYDTEHELKIAPFVDAVFTNERICVDAFRAVNPQVRYLGHAWHPGIHQVMAQSQSEADVAAHDVVFVGTYFQERVDFLAAIDWTGINLGLYGGVDELDFRTTAGRRLKSSVRGGYLRNQRTAALYRSAKVGLNFHRTSKGFGPQQPKIAHAESLNPRCYELAATGCYFVSDGRAEAVDVFGDALETFQTPQECEALIRRALADAEHRTRHAAACQRAVQSHHWVARAEIVRQGLEAVEMARRERAA